MFLFAYMLLGVFFFSFCESLCEKETTSDSYTSSAIPKGKGGTLEEFSGLSVFFLLGDVFLHFPQQPLGHSSVQGVGWTSLSSRPHQCEPPSSSLSPSSSTLCSFFFFFFSLCIDLKPDQTHTSFVCLFVCCVWESIPFGITSVQLSPFPILFLGLVTLPRPTRT